jgi:hypothetical protein
MSRIENHIGIVDTRLSRIENHIGIPQDSSPEDPLTAEAASHGEASTVLGSFVPPPNGPPQEGHPSPQNLSGNASQVSVGLSVFDTGTLPDSGMTSEKDAESVSVHSTES